MTVKALNSLANIHGGTGIPGNRPGIRPKTQENTPTTRGFIKVNVVKRSANAQRITLLKKPLVQVTASKVI